MQVGFSTDMHYGVAVLFVDSNGNESRQRVNHVWARHDGKPPLVNLDNGESSVPHFSDVHGATGRYYHAIV